MKTISLARRPAAAANPTGVPATGAGARLLSAPHRLGFFAAAVLLATTGLWWCLVLVARYAAWPCPGPCLRRWRMAW
jgi:uncharacterized protein involved in response to NO